MKKARRPRPKPKKIRLRGKPIPLPTILSALDERWPNANCELLHADPWQLLVATILSAQCTDATVNKVTPGLFARWPTPADLADANPRELQKAIRPTGFFRNKAKSLLGSARMIVEKFAGKVPDTMDAILELPGVARKTASVVLGNAYGKNEGIAVDTHVTRLTQRWGLTKHDDPKKIEPELMKMLPRERWTSFSHQTIHHGRYLCHARNPECGECNLAEVCPSRVT